MLSVALAVTLGVGMVGGGVEPAWAADFDAGTIISDAKFFDGDALGESGVQQVLDQRVPTCRAAAGQPTCLKSYRSDVTARAGRAGRCQAIAAAQNQTAAAVISTVGKACGISQKALLVMLEKEQGLVTATAPSAGRYRIAMGYGCPDTAACNTTYYGFFNQVYSAAAQFKAYAASPASWNYRAGRANNIGYHPNAACGTKSVYITNQATAGLYIYTPYTPNAAALANPYGAGDSCSSYGNRNFWRIYSDWFGSPVDDGSPFGSLDEVSSVGFTDQVRIRGWAIDADRAEAVALLVFIDGKIAARPSAGGRRDDVGAAYPPWGSYRGFDEQISTSAGRHRVCVRAVDLGAGEDVALGCAIVTVSDGSPIGSMDSVTVLPGAVRVDGWTIDPDVPEPIDVHVYIDGVAFGSVASSDRGDVGAAYPGYGSNHGFSVTLPVESGERYVCAIGINVGRGNSTLHRCEWVTVPD